MRFLFLVLLSFFVPTQAYAWQSYERVNEVSQFTQFRTFRIENMNGSYRGSSEEEKVMIIYHVNRAFRLLDEFYQNPDMCRNRSLNIYHIDGHVIDDRDVMHFVNWDAIGNQSLYGFYDARASPRGTASIFIRRSTDTQFTIDTIVHEVAHHYQYTHCIDQSESEAYSFEAFYRDRTI
jgi:hypothetical protein